LTQGIHQALPLSGAMVEVFDQNNKKVRESQ
jgi:hypothetical protein